MRPVPAILLAALAAATLLPLGEQPATASCAGPYLINADRLMLQRGTTLEIDGAAFADGCQDVGSCSATPGCSTCDYGPEPTPMKKIMLTVRQHGRTWPLDTADARATQDDFGAVTWSVEVPSDLRTGWATLLPEYGEPVKVRVR